MIEGIVAPISVSVAEEIAALQSLAYEPIEIRAWEASEISAILENPVNRLLVSSRKDAQIQGFVLFSLVSDEIEVLSLAVDPYCQRRGVASSMVRELRSIGKHARIARLVLEVAATNRKAIAFYEMLGFSTIATRKNYYSIGGRHIDAQLMEWHSA